MNSLILPCYPLCAPRSFAQSRNNPNWILSILGLHTKQYSISDAFPQCNRTHQQTEHTFFSFSGNLLYSGGSLACVIPSSANILKFLPSDQSIIMSKIPGCLWFCVQAWCVEGTLPLNMQPSTGSWGANRSCVSGPTTSKAVWILLYAANISFSVGVQWAPDPLCPWLPNSRGWPQVSPGVFCQRLQIG